MTRPRLRGASFSSASSRSVRLLECRVEAEPLAVFRTEYLLSWMRVASGTFLDMGSWVLCWVLFGKSKNTP